MSKELNLMLIYREKYLVCTPPSVFTARMRNSIPHNPDSVLCIKFYLKMLLFDLNFLISILCF